MLCYSAVSVFKTWDLPATTSVSLAMVIVCCETTTFVVELATTTCTRPLSSSAAGWSKLQRSAAHTTPPNMVWYVSSSSAREIAHQHGPLEIEVIWKGFRDNGIRHLLLSHNFDISTT